jgi:two-component system nitrate/nitrite response regulator NarL
LERFRTFFILLGFQTSVTQVNHVARILLADDHEVVRSGIQLVLDGQQDWEVCGVAQNGEEAVEKVLGLRPDLIVLDLTMPVMNGLQAASRIRQLAPATKVLIFSVHDTPLMKELSSLVGAHAYLRKTASLQELLNTISLLLQDRAGAHKSTASPSSQGH